METTNRRLQAAKAGLSTHGQLVITEHSGHDVGVGEPGVVIEAVRMVKEKLRVPRREPAGE